MSVHSVVPVVDRRVELVDLPVSPLLYAWVELAGYLLHNSTVLSTELSLKAGMVGLVLELVVQVVHLVLRDRHLQVLQLLDKTLVLWVGRYLRLQSSGLRRVDVVGLRLVAVLQHLLAVVLSVHLLGLDVEQGKHNILALLKVSGRLAEAVEDKLPRYTTEHLPRHLTNPIEQSFQRFGTGDELVYWSEHLLQSFY